MRVWAVTVHLFTFVLLCHSTETFSLFFMVARMVMKIWLHTRVLLKKVPCLCCIQRMLKTKVVVKIFGKLVHFLAMSLTRWSTGLHLLWLLQTNPHGHNKSVGTLQASKWSARQYSVVFPYFTSISLFHNRSLFRLCFQPLFSLSPQQERERAYSPDASFELSPFSSNQMFKRNLQRHLQ